MTPPSSTPTRLLLVLATALLVAPAAAAALHGVAGVGVQIQAGGETSTQADDARDERRAANESARRAPAGQPRTFEPCACDPVEAPWRLGFGREALLLQPGERQSVAFRVENLGREALEIALFGEGAPHVKIHPDPATLRLAPGEIREGLATVGAAPDAPAPYDAKVALHGKAHVASERCREVSTQDRSCDAGHRAAGLLVQVRSHDAGAVRFGVGPGHAYLPPGGLAAFHVYAYNGGTEEITLALAATMRAPEGWTYALERETITLAPGEKAAVPLTVEAPEGAWAGERALLAVKATDGDGRAYFGRAIAEVGHEVRHQETKA